MERYHKSRVDKYPKKMYNKKAEKKDGRKHVDLHKQFKEEAIRLSDEIGVKDAAKQSGVPYYTLAD